MTATEKPSWEIGKTRVLIEENYVRREVRDFGLEDQKGRFVGTAVSFYWRTVTPDESSHILMNDEDLPKGEAPQFGYSLQAQRNGTAFGALNRTMWFDTQEAAEAAAEKAIESSRKRYTRQFA